MGASKVYFANLRTSHAENLQQKLKRLMKTAGFEAIDFDRKYAAIKLHFGEPGNLAYLRPNYAKTVVDYIKELGGKPYLTDCNTLYPGRRKDAVEHLESAYENGYNPLATGCHVIIGDGLKGTDEALVPIEGGKHVKKARIGRAVMDADIFISLNHFKGHDTCGFGGALKNIGMGCGSRAGKMDMHSDSKPLVNGDKCIGCGFCIKECAADAITVADGRANINYDKCTGCGRCIGSCPMDAVRVKEDSSADALNEKIAEYSLAVCHGRPCFHINLLIDVAPNCDCHVNNDMAIIPDVGIFASFDPVAIDMACADMANKQPVLAGSVLHENDHGKDDRFAGVYPESNWRVCLEHAETLGLGTMDYELITI